LAEERVALSQLKEQHSNELVKQKTKLDDACKHHQNTLKVEQEKLRLKEEELGAANSEISRIKSETAKQTDAVEVQKALVMELQGTIARVQITNEELAKLRVNFDHSKSECQALKAERDRLVQDNSRIANSEDSLEQKVRSLSKDIERLEVGFPPCLLWSSPMQNVMDSMQEMEKQQAKAMDGMALAFKAVGDRASTPLLPDIETQIRNAHRTLKIARALLPKP